MKLAIFSRELLNQFLCIEECERVQLFGLALAKGLAQLVDAAQLALANRGCGLIDG